MSVILTVKGVMWDDWDDFRTPVAKNLRRHGMRTFASGEARRVVEMAKDKAIDFAIVDLVDERRGNEMAGLGTIRDIRSSSPRCLIVALTGHAKLLTEKVGPGSVNVATAAGADLVLDKGDLGVLKDTMAFARVVWTGLVKKKLAQIRAENPHLDPRAIVTGLVVGLRCEDYLDLTAVYERPADTEVGSSSINSQNYIAYKRERENLLSHHPGWYVAYHDGKQVALGPDRDEVYHNARTKIVRGLVMVQRIDHPGEELRIRLRRPIPSRSRLGDIGADDK